jgi:hypothetical protein
LDVVVQDARAAGVSGKLRIDHHPAFVGEVREQRVDELLRHRHAVFAAPARAGENGSQVSLAAVPRVADVHQSSDVRAIVRVEIDPRRHRDERRVGHRERDRTSVERAHQRIDRRHDRELVVDAVERRVEERHVYGAAIALYSDGANDGGMLFHRRNELDARSGSHLDANAGDGIDS